LDKINPERGSLSPQSEAGPLADDSSERYRELYTILMETIPSSVLIVDRDMRIVYTNRNFLEKSRRLKSNTIGYRLEEIFPPIIIEQIPITDQIRQVFNTQKPTKGQRMSFRAPGVSMRIYYYRIVPFPWEGSVECVVLLMDDVTEQIQLSEEVGRVQRHISSIVESASDIVLSTDIDGKILSWNPAAERISGYTFEEVREQFFPKYCAKDYQPTINKVFAEMKYRKGSITADWELVTKIGSDVHVSWVCSPMKDQRSQTIGIVVVGRDHTERRRMEMQLFQSQKLAALGVMAGGIAHEIRNPLAICSSAAQFLLDNDISPDFRKECAEKIHVGIQRVSTIIENLLKFSRPPLKSGIEKINFINLVREAVALISNQAGIQKIKLKSYLPEESIFIRGSAGLLQQVFINLFLNSFKAMPDGGTLSISVENTKTKIMIRVADTGHGILPENQNNIFDPFYTTSPVGKGTGLGLSICYAIIEQHFGTIEIDSAEGKGTTFTITLPIF
jgi:PAS domain S-box-containing protein